MSPVPDPEQVEVLMRRQAHLARLRPEPWAPGAEPLVGACWACFPRGVLGRGRTGDPAWVAAVVMAGRRVVASLVRYDHADAPYSPGLMALRVRRPLAAAVEGLETRPDVLLLDATGRDHPRGAGLTIDLGEQLSLPTVGVTHRPLTASGPWPPDAPGATSPLLIAGEPVAAWLRTRPGARPLVVHPGWRTGLDTAQVVVRATTGRHRTPEPLRLARRLAREARTAHLRARPPD